MASSRFSISRLVILFFLFVWTLGSLVQAAPTTTKTSKTLKSRSTSTTKTTTTKTSRTKTTKTTKGLATVYVTIATTLSKCGNPVTTTQVPAIVTTTTQTLMATQTFMSTQTVTIGAVGTSCNALPQTALCFSTQTTLISSCKTCSKTSTVTSTTTATATSYLLGMSYSTTTTTSTVTDLYRLIDKQQTCSITVTQSSALVTSTVKFSTTTCKTAKSIQWITSVATATQYVQSTQTVLRVLNAFADKSNVDASCLAADQFGLATRTSTATDTITTTTTSTNVQTSVLMTTYTAVVSATATSTTVVPSILTLSVSVCGNYTSLEFATSTISLFTTSTSTLTTNVQLTKTFKTTVAETTGTVYFSTTKTYEQRNTYSTTVTVRWLARYKRDDEKLPVEKRDNVLERQQDPQAAAASSSAYSRPTPSTPIPTTNTDAYYKNLVPTPFPNNHPVNQQSWFSLPNVQKPEPSSQEAKIIKASAYGVTPSSKDNTRSLNQAIDACRRFGKPCRVVLDPPNQTFIFDSGSSVFFGGLRNFTFDGLGGRLLYRNPRRPSSLMFVSDCKFCLWTNFYMDWDWDVWRLGTRVFVEDATQSRLTLTPVDLVEPDPPKPRFAVRQVVNGTGDSSTTSTTSTTKTTTTSTTTTSTTSSTTTTTLTPSPYLDLSKIWQWTSMHMIDPKRRSMAVRGGDEFFRLQDSVTSARSISRTSLELRMSNAPPVEPGHFYLAKHFFYEQPCISSEACVHCTWERIWVVSCPGKVMTHDTDSEYLWIRDLKVAPITYPPPQNGPFTQGGDNGKGGGTGKGWYKQPITATADGLFFERVKGKIVIENTEVGWHGDDAVNIHDSVGLGFRIRDGNSITVLNSPDYRMSFHVGDQISFTRPDLSDPGFYTKVVGVKQNGDNWDLDLQDGLPDSITSQSSGQLSDWLVLNWRWKCKDVVIRNFWAHDNRARGIFLQASNFIVADSVLEYIQQPGIKIGWDVAGNAEGTGTKNVLIVNNVLDHVDRNDFQGEGALHSYVKNTNGGDNNPTPIKGHVNLIIQSNLIRNVPKRAMDITGTVNATIQMNRIEMTEPDLPTQLYRGALRFDKNDGIRLDRNVFLQTPYGPPPTPLSLNLDGNSLRVDSDLDAGGLNTIYQQSDDSDGPLTFAQGGKEIRPSSSGGGIQPKEPPPAYIPGQVALRLQLQQQQMQQQ